MRALCVPKGGVQPLLKESGPLETGTQSTVRDKFDALGVHCLFLLSFACNAFCRYCEILFTAHWLHLKRCDLLMGSLG